jgi:hypothetical protein
MENIKASNSVAIHIRFFDDPDMASKNNISINYYRSAINHINSNIENPKYFLFSDNPEYALAKLKHGLNLDIKNTILISNNKGDEHSYADLWLMSHCQHFIIANSTFSWWAAWLANGANKMVIYPKLVMNDDGNMPWAMTEDMPEAWLAM